MSGSSVTLIQGKIWPTRKRQLNKAVKKTAVNTCFCTGKTNFSCCKAITMHLLGKRWSLKQEERLLKSPAPRRRLSNWAPKKCIYMHVFGCALKFSILAIALLQSSQNLEVSTKRVRFKKQPQESFCCLCHYHVYFICIFKHFPPARQGKLFFTLKQEIPVFPLILAAL